MHLSAKLLPFLAVASAGDPRWRSLTAKLPLSQFCEHWQGIGYVMRHRSWRNCHQGHKFPPEGAVYAATLGMPIIGVQTFMFHIRNRRRGHYPGEVRGRAQITLKGAMNLNEPALFHRHSTGTIDMTFNEATLALLTRMRTRIVGATYSVENDSIELVIAPPLWRHIRVKLPRQ